jgi:hypothetical protein
LLGSTFETKGDNDAKENDGKYGKLVFLEHAAKIRKERQTSKYFVDNLTHWEKMIIFATTNNSGMA